MLRFLMRCGAVVLLAACLGMVPATPASAPVRAEAASTRSDIHLGQRTVSIVPEALVPPVQEVPTGDFDKSGFRDDVTSTRYFVNKKWGAPSDYVPTDLVTVDHGQRLRAETAAAYQRLVAAAKKDGVTLVALSGYRSYEEQRAVHDGLVSSRGLSAENVSAPPGHSEHQLGLAIDVGAASDTDCALRTCFGSTPAGRWVLQHAAEYGFLIRYPDGQQDATGYEYEPWHLRYLGAPVVAQIQRSNARSYEEWITSMLPDVALR